MMNELEYRQSREYELVSRLINSPEMFPLVAGNVLPEYFQDDFCRQVYGEMQKQGKFSRFSLEKAGLEREGLILAEGMTVLACNTPFQVESAAWFVVEHYKRAELAKLTSTSNFDDDFEETSRKIAKLRELNVVQTEKDNATEEVFIKADRLFRGEADPRNVPTGFCGVDRNIEGFHNSELVIIGGRPGSGKTTIAMNMAVNMAKAGKKVLFLSLEMSKAELIERVVISLTGMRVSQQMAQSDIEKWFRCIRWVEQKLSLRINDKAGITIEEIAAISLRLKKRGELDVVFIDNLSILKTNRAFKSRYEEVSEISRQLKVMAKELEVPVVCLCQLNRAVEARALKAPTLADLRDSGSIEQDADLITFVYRPEYHLKQSEPDDKMSNEYTRWLGEVERVKNKAFFIVAKNRRGETANIELKFNGYKYSFLEAA